MKFIKYLIFFLVLQGCSGNYEWGWYILSPNNIEGLTNLKFLISGITTTIYISVVSIILAMIIGLIVVHQFTWMKMVSGMKIVIIT